MSNLSSAVGQNETVYGAAHQQAAAQAQMATTMQAGQHRIQKQMQQMQQQMAIFSPLAALPPVQPLVYVPQPVYPAQQ